VKIKIYIMKKNTIEGFGKVENLELIRGGFKFQGTENPNGGTDEDVITEKGDTWQGELCTSDYGLMDEYKDCLREKRASTM
jgi:hypothetical protein